jgi:hypothetical protein
VNRSGCKCFAFVIAEHQGVIADGSGAWWSWPEQCEHGHELGSGRMLVSFERCDCAPGPRGIPGPRPGHMIVACGAEVHVDVVRAGRTRRLRGQAVTPRRGGRLNGCPQPRQSRPAAERR